MAERNALTFARRAMATAHAEAKKQVVNLADTFSLLRKRLDDPNPSHWFASGSTDTRPLTECLERIRILKELIEHMEYDATNGGN